MDVNQSYLQRLVDLSKPLKAKAEIAQSVPLAPIKLEENVEVLSFSEAVQNSPEPVVSTERQSFASERDQNPDLATVLKNSQDVGIMPTPVKSLPLQEEESQAPVVSSEIFTKKTQPMEVLQTQVSPKEESLKTSFEKEIFADEKSVREFPAIEELWSDVFSPKESFPQDVKNETPSEAPVREFFTHSHETKERFEEHFEKHYHEKEKVMVFTPEQKQTIHQYIQVAVQAVEKKAAEAKPQIETPMLSPVKASSWKGWSGEAGNYTRSKLRIR